MKLISSSVWMAAVLLVSGCQSGDVHVADLNKVLDVFVAVLDKPLEGDAAAPATENEPKPVEDNAETTNKFLGELSAALNESKIVTVPMAVQMRPDGAIEGFVDTNQNSAKDGEEQHLFKVEIDKEGSRLIATDESGPYHRDRGYTFRPGGFFMGYMLGSMLSRQGSFFGGSNPNFRSMQMSPPNYHADAKSAAKTRAAAARSSARAKSGSGGFRFGK